MNVSRLKLNLNHSDEARRFIVKYIISEGIERPGWIELPDGSKIDLTEMSDEEAIAAAKILYDQLIYDGKSSVKH